MAGQTETRRLKDTLSIAGTAVIAFDVWSLAKIALFLSFVDEKTLPQLLQQLLGVDDATVAIAMYTSLVTIAIIDLCFRAYVGLSARAEARGARKSPLYLVVAAIVAIANVSSIAAIAFGTTFSSSPLNMIISIAIEATAFAALALVIFSSIRLRRMSKATG